MHRTHLAGLCAVALPGALAVGHGIFAAPVLLGLWLTRSWTAWLASLVGVTWLYPWFGPVAILLRQARPTLIGPAYHPIGRALTPIRGASDRYIGMGGQWRVIHSPGHRGHHTHPQPSSLPPCTVTVNPDYTSVANAVAAAQDGDVICLNAGNVTWVNQLDVGTKAVHLRGAGTYVAPWGSAGQTSIYANTSAGALIGGYESTSHSMQISNIKFTFDQNSAVPTYGLITWNRQANGLPWLIHHNDFSVTGRDDAPKFMVTGAHGGVIYRNKFTAERIAPNYINTNIEVISIAVSDDGSWWGSASTMGINDSSGLSNIYLETNYIDGFNVIYDLNTSGRIVFRHNEVHNASTSGHGYDSSTYGQRHEEIYNNEFLCDGVIALQAWITKRGGSGVITDNIFHALTNDLCRINGAAGNGTSIFFDQYKCRQCEEIGGWPGVYSDTYPMSHQTGWGWISGSNQAVGDSTHQNDPGGAGFQQALEPIYVWNNTNSADALLAVNTGYVGTCRAMAYSNTGKATGTTLPLSAFVSAGQDSVVVFADLIGGTAPSIADSLGNTWTALQGGTNGSMRLSAWRGHITTGGYMTVTITFDSSAAARAGVLVNLRQLVAAPLDQNPAVVTDNASPYLGPASGTLAQADEVVIGYFALNGPTTFSQTNPVSFVNDAVAVTSPDIRAISGPVSDRVGITGTTGGVATTNVTVALTYWTGVREKVAIVAHSRFLIAVRHASVGRRLSTGAARSGGRPEVSQMAAWACTKAERLAVKR